GYNILYGCSHFLGIDLEREVREWYFLCTAGLYVASITSSGDIVACLDIEKRPELIQGNILKDRLKDVWETKFKIFRKDLSDLNEKCRNCPDCEFCNGGAHHSWNYDTNEQNICFKGILF
ncbi:MAG: SPASM domain-containing protein, partial [Clostridia bacterium]|nr:SPASM domain-containing protein [Clostridia bacterium]